MENEGGGVEGCLSSASFVVEAWLVDVACLIGKACSAIAMAWLVVLVHLDW